MREIKFRGKRLDTKELIYGSYIEAQMRDGSVCHEIVPYEAGAAVVEVDPATVGQYTGLKDKNGREIYKGDILKWGDNRTKVVDWFIDGWTAGNNGTSMPLADFIRRADCYVIGNIHDNPKLLKGG